MRYKLFIYCCHGNGVHYECVLQHRGLEQKCTVFSHDLTKLWHFFFFLMSLCLKFYLLNNAIQYNTKIWQIWLCNTISQEWNNRITAVWSDQGGTRHTAPIFAEENFAEFNITGFGCQNFLSTTKLILRNSIFFSHSQWLHFNLSVNATEFSKFPRPRNQILSEVANISLWIAKLKFLPLRYDRLSISLACP